MTNVSSNRGITIGAAPLSGIYNSTDSEYNTTPLGLVTTGANGRRYMFVQASAGIADDTAVILTINATAPTHTVAGGSGVYTTRSGAVTTGQRFWVESNAG